MSNPLYQNRGNSQSHEEELKRPPLSAKDLEAGVLGTRPLGLMNVPGLLEGLGGGGRNLSGLGVFFISKHKQNKLGIPSLVPKPLTPPVFECC